MAGIHQKPNLERDVDWLEFENLLSELAELAKSGMPFGQMVKPLLEKTVHIVAAAGGAVWLSNGLSPLRLEYRVLGEADDDILHQDFHRQLLEHARAEGETLVVPPGGAAVGAQTLPNPTDYVVLIGPLTIDQDVVGLLEILQQATTSAAAMRGTRRLLGLVCELASDHLRRTELRQLRDEQLLTRNLEEFAERVHGTLDVRTLAYELVNAGRQFIDCDRVSLAIRKGRKFRLVAVSSIDSINRRSNVVRRLEQVAVRVARANETIWHDDDGDEALASQILESLRQYSDAAHPRTIGLIPLNAASSDQRQQRTKPLGVLVVEQYNSVLDSKARERADQVARQSRLALANALRYQSLPTLPFARRRNRPVGQPAVRISVVMALASAAALVASLFFIEGDFDVRAEGKLQPEQQQHVFAPFDAQVASIAVKHGDKVAANDLLVELRSPEIDLESQRIQGEVDTTQKRISTIDSTLLQMNVADAQEENRFSQLAGEQEELKQMLASQKEQLDLLRLQRDKLVLRSPIAGQILTWDLEQLLSNRPVQRGQALLSVANLNGPWVAELEVPDDQIGYVFESNKGPERMWASFQLATDRGTDFKGELRRISSRTETTDGDRSIVRVTMDVDENDISELRPGATIFAKIHCGQRSLAYVWFHGLVEAVQNWFRF